jgi:hypothetical protein
MTRSVFMVAAVVAGAALAVASASYAPAHAGGPGKDEKKAPDDLAELTADWWQWVYASPAKDVTVKTGPHSSTTTNTNPVLDSTGDFARGMEHEKGPGDKYFFLAGDFGGTVTRNIDVPHGKALFFPVINSELDNAVDPPTNYTVAELSAIAKANIDATTSMSATFDGVPVDTFRTQSPAFSYKLPKHDSIYEYFGLTGPQFQGTVSPAVSDGWWGVIDAPSKGTHVLHFTSTGPGFALDVTYNLNVK